MASPESEQEMKDALEGLAMCMLKSAKVRDECGNDISLLAALAAAIEVQKYMFSALQVLAYASAYRPRMSDEQKKMQQLQAYAANSQVPPPNPLDDDDHVTKRCRKIVEAKVVSHIVKAAPRATHLSASLAVQIINSLSFDKKHRGMLAQQGAVRILAKLWEAAKQYADQKESISTQIPACNAVARILISTDPTVYFTGEARKEQILPTCAKMLQQLISHEPDDDGPRNWLPTFEALLALTNLASLEDMAFKEAIAKDSFVKIEDLLLSSNHNIRMRAMELLTNLSYTPTVLSMFSTDMRAKQRLDIVLALVTAAEKGTRLAALGSLCMMTEASETVSRAFIRNEKSKAMATRIIDPPVEDVELAEPVGEDEQYRLCYLIRTLANSAEVDMKRWVTEWASGPARNGEGTVAGRAAMLMLTTQNQEMRDILTQCLLKDVQLSEDEKAALVVKVKELGLGS
ncbi:hypothetical protein, variant [Verruconis gallopava]|nr:hypothetical protein, variant [Verruconis gallopava]KIW06658.1 hypothetical protein, variant [Verruconis gallopava]